jgi:hypothetical protein
MTSCGYGNFGGLSRPIGGTSLTVGENSRDEPPQFGIEV